MWILLPYLHYAFKRARKEYVIDLGVRLYVKKSDLVYRDLYFGVLLENKQSLGIIIITSLIFYSIALFHIVISYIKISMMKINVKIPLCDFYVSIRVFFVSNFSNSTFKAIVCEGILFLAPLDSFTQFHEFVISSTSS